MTTTTTSIYAIYKCRTPEHDTILRVPIPSANTGELPDEKWCTKSGAPVAFQYTQCERYPCLFHFIGYQVITYCRLVDGDIDQTSSDNFLQTGVHIRALQIELSQIISLKALDDERLWDDYVEST